MLGYALGRQYPRRARYSVTAGDIGILQLTSLLGVAAGAIPFVDRDSVDDRALAGALTAGLLAGVAVGDVTLVRRYDHTEAEAWRVKLGALAGGLLGGAVVVLAETNASTGFSLVIAGAIGGTYLAERVVAPERDRSRLAALPSSAARIARRDDGRVQVDVAGTLMTVLGMPGRYELMRLRF
jgi:hypothetical protein